MAITTGICPAMAGNIALTGHDDDYHAQAGPNTADALKQLGAMAAFARAGARYPGQQVLVFDHGAQLTEALGRLGIPYRRVDPDSAPLDPALFDARRFSAIGVASDQSCGGCDNTEASAAALGAARPLFARFLNQGGGVFAFAGGSERNYYSFLPTTVQARGHPAANGYDQTRSGMALSIPAVNGDETHNFFAAPGESGQSQLFMVAETYSGHDDVSGTQVTNVPATLAIKGVRVDAAGFRRAGLMEGLMEASTIVISFGLLAFAVERLTNGVAVILGYWPWWRRHMEPVAGAADQSMVERNRRVALFALSAILAVAGAILARLNLLGQLSTLPAATADVTAAAAKSAAQVSLIGYVVTGLMIAAGADPIRELLKQRGSRDERAPSAPIQVSGTLVVQRDRGGRDVG
jgi:hypothetical protein